MVIDIALSLREVLRWAACCDPSHIAVLRRPIQGQTTRLGGHGPGGRSDGTDGRDAPTIAVQGYNSLSGIGVEALTGFVSAYVLLELENL